MFYNPNVCLNKIHIKQNHGILTTVNFQSNPLVLSLYHHWPIIICLLVFLCSSERTTRLFVLLQWQNIAALPRSERYWFTSIHLQTTAQSRYSECHNIQWIITLKEYVFFFLFFLRHIIWYIGLFSSCNINATIYDNHNRYTNVVCTKPSLQI